MTWCLGDGFPGPLARLLATKWRWLLHKRFSCTYFRLLSFLYCKDIMEKYLKAASPDQMHPGRDRTVREDQRWALTLPPGRKKTLLRASDMWRKWGRYGSQIEQGKGIHLLLKAQCHISSPSPSTFPQSPQMSSALLHWVLPLILLVSFSLFIYFAFCILLSFHTEKQAAYFHFLVLIHPNKTMWDPWIVRGKDEEVQVTKLIYSGCSKI